eukprot:6187406-Pleurochrysis_carterae.AAC.9
MSHTSSERVRAYCRSCIASATFFQAAQQLSCRFSRVRQGLSRGSTQGRHRRRARPCRARRIRARVRARQRSSGLRTQAAAFPIILAKVEGRACILGQHPVPCSSAACVP